MIFFKQGIAKELKEIQVQLVDMYINKKPPNMKMLLRMEEILHRLDDRIKLSSTMKKTEETKVEVCPEIYKGTKEGYPYYAKGWAITNCTNAKPIEYLITILINTISYSEQDEKHVPNVLKGIADTYPTIQVYLATQRKYLKEYSKKYKNVDVVVVSNSERSARTWNLLISKASTPYVVIAKDVVHFSWLCQLERQIRVVSEVPKIGVAGGSFRNLSGHWQMGCYQTTLKNYVLEYQEGYFYSRNECMFCDYLQGPFVAKKALIKFDTTLQDEVIFEDLFLGLVKSGHLLMGCPDAMYFTTDYSSYAKQNDRNVWMELARKWELNRVLLPVGVKHSFSCKDIGFKCFKSHTKSFLLPVCCQEQYAKAIQFIQKFSEKHNISFELDTGSVLGSVKYVGLLPWDVDGDLAVLSSDMKIFGEKETFKHFKKNGYRITDFKPPVYNPETKLMTGGAAVVRLPELYIELWGISFLTNPQFLPSDLQKSTSITKAKVRSEWINTVFSPGLFVRNRYGKEVLRHAQSWTVTGLKHSFISYVSGTFKKCKSPEHHACLENFPADGNIPVLVP